MLKTLTYFYIVLDVTRRTGGLLGGVPTSRGSCAAGCLNLVSCMLIAMLQIV